MKTIAAAAALAALAAGGAAATPLDVTVTNTASAGGFSLTPFLSVFHDGSFDPVSQGREASAGLETLAETGVTADLDAKRMNQVPGSTSTVVRRPGMPPALQPGDTFSSRIDVDPSDQRFFSYFSMLVPSYDTFVGTEDPTGTAIFGSDGAYLGDRSIELTGADILESNTEVNNRENGVPAFLPATGIGVGGADEGGVIGEGEAIPGLAGEVTAAGYTLDGDEIAFTTNPDAFDVATIEVAEVAPVPVPGAGVMLVGGLGLLGLGRRLRRRV